MLNSRLRVAALLTWAAMSGLAVNAQEAGMAIDKPQRNKDSG